MMRIKKGFTMLNNPQKGLAARGGCLTGFTLLELVITVGIIALALVALLAFAVNLLKTVSLSKNQLIAYNLAEEGVEILNHLGQGCISSVPTNPNIRCNPSQGIVCGYTAGITDYIVIADSNPQTHSDGFVENRCNNYSVAGGDDSQFMLINPSINPLIIEPERLYLCSGSGNDSGKGYVHSSSPIFDAATCKPTPFKRKIIAQRLPEDDLFNENGWKALRDAIGRRYRYISEVSWDSPFGEQKVAIPTHVIHFIKID